MDHSDLAFSSALEQADLLARGDVSSVELVDLYLARIEELNPRLNAYITVAADFARATAKEADDRRAAGGDVPKFLGVPISIKDLADTAGIVSTHGTTEWRDRVPDRDDVVVAKLRAAGFVFLGKTVVPEFGPLNISEPPGYPPGRNPWDPDRSSGGSSGGAAARSSPGCARHPTAPTGRLDPQPVVVVRRVRPQAAARAHLARCRTRRACSRSTVPSRARSPTPQPCSTSCPAT